MRTMFANRGRVVALVVALMALASCKTGEYGAQPALVVSGEVLAGLGEQFATVAAVYTAQCVPAVRVPQLAGFCAGFKDFAPKFQEAYPLAVQTFRAAAEANDVAKAQGAEKTILLLATQLTAIAGQALAVMGKQP